MKSKRRVVDWRALKRTPVEMLEKRFIWRGRRKNNGPTVDKEAHLFPRSFIFKTRVARARCTMLPDKISCRFERTKLHQSVHSNVKLAKIAAGVGLKRDDGFFESRAFRHACIFVSSLSVLSIPWRHPDPMIGDASMTKNCKTKSPFVIGNASLPGRAFRRY